MRLRVRIVDFVAWTRSHKSRATVSIARMTNRINAYLTKSE